MKVGFHNLVRQYHSLKPAIDAAIQEVLESGVYVLGPKLEKFERELAEYCGMNHAVGLNSGTDALWLTMKALGIGPADEVIVTANSYFATAEAIWITGANAVFVDINPETHNIEPSLIEPAITDRTKAIIAVLLYGLPAHMSDVATIARKHNLLVIEDCAQALGARGGDFRLGELSDAMCVSFTPQKNLGAYGDGGAVLTNRPEVAERVRKLRNHGSPHSGTYSMGFNSRLDEIQAAILSVKLQELDRWVAQRRTLAQAYRDGLANTSLRLPTDPAGLQHTYQFFVVESDQRDNLQGYLAEKGITAMVHYPRAIHRQEGFPWAMNARNSGSLVHTERAAARVLSLPLYPEMTGEEIDYVIRTVTAWEEARQR
jgi:dTDP-4-amino-4,6-dideoxygalactose transaminase